LRRAESALNAREAISEGEISEWSLCMGRRGLSRPLKFLDAVIDRYDFG
jgi:hypothetical protein